MTSVRGMTSESGSRCGRPITGWRVAVLSLALLVSMGGVASAAPFIVAPGWDLLQSVGGTKFLGIPFEGVPIGSFDFGAGPVATGMADTIVRRMAPASSAAPQNPGGPFQGPLDDLTGNNVIPIEIVALLLRSVVPIDLGAGLAFHYITLSSMAPSTGFARVNFSADGSGGTFDSFFDVFVDVRINDPSGPIIVPGLQKHFVSTSAVWSRDADAARAALLPLLMGVNYKLNGVNTAQDFQLGLAVHVNDPGQTEHVVRGAAPEPATLALLALGVGALAGRRLRRR